MRLDHVDLLQRSHDQELQPEPGEEVEGIPRRSFGSPAEGLVDDHEPERLGARHPPVQFELVGQRCGQDGVGQLLLLATGLPGRVRVVLVLLIVDLPSLGGGEHEPLADIRHPACPGAILVGHALAALEPVDDLLDL